LNHETSVEIQQTLSAESTLADPIESTPNSLLTSVALKPVVASLAQHVEDLTNVGRLQSNLFFASLRRMRLFC
jgi:ABC-type long-subunit fatty acid transport system fused permease/ATPase subunit